jgi:hypothetical protein
VAALGALGTLLSGFGGLLAIFGNLAHVAAMFGFVVCHLDLLHDQASFDKLSIAPPSSKPKPAFLNIFGFSWFFLPGDSGNASKTLLDSEILSLTCYN